MKKYGRTTICKILILAFLVAAAGIFWGGVCYAQFSYQWDGNESIDFQEPLNWTPEGIPGQGDTIIIPGGTLYQPEITSTVAIQYATVENGGKITVKPTGQFTVDSGMEIDAGFFENNGIFNWAGGDIYSLNTTTITNGAGATFVISGTGRLSDDAVDTTFVNNGEIRKDSAERSIIAVKEFRHHGAISVLSGELQLGGSDSMGRTCNYYGSFDIASGASIFLADYIHYFNEGFSTSGQGDVVIGGPEIYNEIYLMSDIVFDSGLSLRNGIVQGGYDLTVNGTFRWTGGLIEGYNSGEQVVLNGESGIHTGLFKKIYGLSMIVNGPMIMDTDTLTLGSSARFEIAAESSCNVMGSTAIKSYDETVNSFINNGKLRGIGTLSFVNDPEMDFLPPVFENNGEIIPGLTELGQLSIQDADFKMAPGTLRVRIFDPLYYDKLQITGSPSLGGTLIVTLPNSFLESSGGIFTVLESSGPISGTFDALELPQVPEIEWQVSYDSNSVNLTAIRRTESTPLTIVISPPGSGSVSTGSFICPPVCENSFPPDQPIVLTAEQAAGYVFDRWFWYNTMEEVTDTNNPITFQIGTAQSLTALFVPESTPPHEDFCPDDPNKIYPGLCGCGIPDTDSDGDGFPDCIDSCIDDFNKSDPGICGCGYPDTDLDGDGTYDCYDLCPLDPDKTEPGVCGCGLPDADLDGDGEIECEDLCPDDPLKAAPGVCGCGFPDIDLNGDGEIDCEDLCPDDPLKVAPGVCGCGVPDIDLNGDGEIDCGDLCPDDPEKTLPGICGCGVPDADTDGDGIPDCIDPCPSDPIKDKPGICGCGVPDLDTDGDGVFDCNDLCPNDPAKSEPGICGCGLPDTDTDGDGVSDCNDPCPDDSDKIALGICGCGSADTDANGNGIADCVEGKPLDGEIGLYRLQIPPGTERSDYRMRAFPIILAQGESFCEDFLSELFGAEGYSPFDFRIGTYDPELGDYLECGEGLEFIPGHAYWFLARNGIDIQLQGPQVDLEGAVDLPLGYNRDSGIGWNMIAAPGNAAYRWNQLLVAAYLYDEQGNFLRLQEYPIASLGENNPYVNLKLWRWQDGGYRFYHPDGDAASDIRYVDDPLLGPGFGYWVEAKKKDLFLRFVPEARALGRVDRALPRQARRAAPAAGASDEPPMPMGDFFSADGSSGGGSCFVEMVGKTEE